MGHFIPTHTTARTEETAQLFFRYVISQHGIPTTLISNRDPKFTSKFWKELMSLMGTKLAMSSAYHPQTDGQTERLNQIVEQLLRAACKDDISKWDAHLPVLEFAYNNATHAATGQTPFFLCYGRNPLTPQKPTVPATVQPAHDFITTMHHLWERTHKRTAGAGGTRAGGTGAAGAAGPRGARTRGTRATGAGGAAGTGGAEGTTGAIGLGAAGASGAAGAGGAARAGGAGGAGTALRRPFFYPQP
ncbi:unnamed protein product [Closterium sp. NIES-54]